MTSPYQTVCVGTEFVTGGTLKFSGTTPKSWPYKCKQSQASGLFIDPTATQPAPVPPAVPAAPTSPGGLWVDPVIPTAGNPNSAFAASTVPPLGVNTALSDLSFTYTNPTCLPQQLVVTTQFRAIGTLPLLAYLHWQAEQLIGAAGATINFGALPYRCSQHCWNYQQLSFAFNAVGVSIASVPANGTVTVHRQQSVYSYSAGSGGTAVAATISRQSVLSQVMAFNTPNPLAGP